MGIAVTGSAASGAEDRWSDVDLFLGVRGADVVAETLADYSAFVHDTLGAVHHLDLQAGPAVYRAFLLTDLLEVDLGFAPASAFGPRGDGAFRVLAGQALERQTFLFDVNHMAGLTWHHIMHARTAIERGNLWQAEYWVSALRDITLQLAAHRFGLDTAYAKAADRLPSEVTAALPATLVRTLDATELRRALRAVTGYVLEELRACQADMAPALANLLNPLTLDGEDVTW